MYPLTTDFHKVDKNCSWYQDPNIDLNNIPAATHLGEVNPKELQLSGSLASASNPIEWAGRRNQKDGTLPRTQTIGAREVHQTVQAAFRPMLAGIQTQDQMEEFIGCMVRAQ